MLSTIFSIDGKNRLHRSRDYKIGFGNRISKDKRYPGLIDKLFNDKKLDSNPICKTNFLVSRLDDNLNDKMINDKKSNNHIIQIFNDNVSY